MKIFATYIPVKHTEEHGEKPDIAKAECVEIMAKFPLQVIILRPDGKLKATSLDRLSDVHIKER